MAGSEERSLSSLKELEGKSLSRISRILFEHRGELDESDGAVELNAFGEVFLLDGAPDGQSLRLRRQAWIDPFTEPLSAENQSFVQEHGKWVRVDKSDEEKFASLVAKPISRVVALADEHGVISGVRITVEDSSMWVVVQGDECRVFWVHPLGFKEEKSIW